MQVVPVNVCIKRFYRAYARVDEDAGDEQIRKVMIDAIIENQDDELTEDPDLEIEECDIVDMIIDYDNAWTEEEI